ncbi:Bidirectional sugar transporter SWEET17 [Phytophthora nicotianae]|uniref:Bidirectional sugar transporter SWEET17 n=1 Tax=Phytophthora nicotianae TaxID=4792 RepID=A0A0W8D5X0_PHYNI|nr:Bidirectional sugar transporter SWEET17 [Phytophthora nicotianae]KUF91799.1 Sugar phosphate exchanger 3 [Phytophthora nicotianae]
MADASILLVLRIMTALSSLMVSLSPSFSIYKIYKSKTVDNISIVPFVSLLGNAHMWMMYGYFCGKIFPVVVSFGFADVAAIAYISVYYKFAENREYVLQIVSGAVSILTAITLYVAIAATGATGQDYTSISHVLGYLSIVAAIILYGAPFEKVLFVLRNKSATPIQLPMVICGAAIKALWVIYTPLDSNWFMFIPNAICVVLGIVLLTLYVLYRPGKVVQPTVDLSDEDIAITIVVSSKAETHNKVANDCRSVQPMPSPLLPLSRENSFQLSSPSMSRGSSFQQMSSPALSTRSGSFYSSSFDRNSTVGVVHVIRASRQ